MCMLPLDAVVNPHLAFAGLAAVAAGLCINRTIFVIKS